MNVKYLAYTCIHTSTSDGFTLYTSQPPGSMPFHKDTHGCLGMLVKTHVVKCFGNQETDAEEHTRMMSSQQDQLHLRWRLQKPGTEFIRVRTCSTYIEREYNGGNWDIHSRRSYRAVNTEKTQDETKQDTQTPKPRTGLLPRSPCEERGLRFSLWKWGFTWKARLSQGFIYRIWTSMKDTQSVQCVLGWSGRGHTATFWTHIARENISFFSSVWFKT